MTTRRTMIIDALVATCVTATAFAGAACKKSSNGPSGPNNPPSGSWLTGEDGTMYNIGADGALSSGYDLEAEQDLLGIACRGLDTAFVVGEQGTMLRTFDGGASWESIDLNTTRTLRDVAAARPELVLVAGDQLLLVSRDSGDTWTDLPAAAANWLSIATDHEGGAALALAADGSIWRWVDGDDALGQVGTVTGGRAVSVSHNGTFAAVAGDGGALALSADGGLTWSALATGTDVDLYAAWVTDSGDAIAVGAGGTVVRAGSDGVQVATPGSGTLRAVHINAAGEGLAAGEGGQVLHTGDAGRTWQIMPVTLPSTVYGLDEVDGEGHL